MKPVFTFFWILLSINLLGQSYTPFIDTNSIWRENKIIDFVHGSSLVKYNWWDSQEIIVGDTIIGKNILSYIEQDISATIKLIIKPE